jgi:hypothetical protein
MSTLTMPAVAATPKRTFEPIVLASGLDNPRQLHQHGNLLLIAEAGHGADDPADCVEGPYGPFCVGDTGAVSQLLLSGRGGVQTVVSGLPSGAGPDGSFAGGVHGVARANRGELAVAIGEVPEIAGPNGASSELLRVDRRGRTSTWADLLDYELDANPDGQTQFGEDGEPLDALSNPYAVATRGSRLLVADAGANAILEVDRHGTVSTFAVLPLINDGDCEGAPNNTEDGSTGCDPVPTAITFGHDGFVYVAGLGGEAPGTGRVWKLHHRSGEIVTTYDGLTTPHGVTVTPDGTVWVSELFANADFSDPDLDPSTVGQVTRIATNGSRTSIPVPLPAGLASRGPWVYVSAWSVAPAAGLFGNPDWTGEVWRVN